MKTVITGGTGFVGSRLAEALLKRGYSVTLLSSRGKSLDLDLSIGSLQSIKADTTKEGVWQERVAESDVIINLAGRSVFHKWSTPYKKEIYDSRIETTRNIVKVLQPGKDQVLLSGSAAGYYGGGQEKEKDEGSAHGGDYLAEVCKDWEKEAHLAEKKGVRVATMRFGVVLGKDGGPMKTMKLPFKLGLGGPIGSGKQWFPWIHIEDLILGLLFILDGDNLHGAFNFVAPETVRQKEFARKLGKAYRRPAFLPMPAIIMKSLFGEFGQSLLQGQKVVPRKFLDNGYVFKYPDLEGCLKDLVSY